MTSVKFCLLVILLLTAAQSYAADLTVSQGPIKRVLTPKDLHRLRLDSTQVKDPVYNRPKRYAGYWLSDILTLAGLKPDSNNVLVFKALDGYKARITVSEVIASKAKAFVAVKDLEAPDGWQMITQGKESVSPGPYYLVWQIPSNAPTDSKLPWPYQIDEISVQGLDEAQDKLFPDTEDKSESIERGYKIFRQNCLSCHSLNLEGGVLGPELNVPRNILEYRDRKTLLEFIGDPSSFRAKSKMPAFSKTLSEQSMDDVLDYLSWMGKHKID